MLRAIEFALMKWTDLARRGAWLVLIAVLGLAGAAGWFAASRLSVNTDTSAMLDPGLDFQQRAKDLREAFPELKSDISIVIRADTLDETEAFTAALRERLLARDDAFTSVFAPSADPFFLENGLLYLSESDLDARLDTLTKAGGLIETLARDPSAGVLFTTLADNDALAEKSDIGPDTLEDLYEELARVAESVLAANPGAEQNRPFAWMGALDPDEPPSGRYMRVIQATPILDFTRLQPARAALDVLNAELADLDASFRGRVETFVTGDPALRADELSAVTTGLGLSFGLSLVLVSVLLLMAYRSAYLSFVTILSLVVAIVLTAAFAAATVKELNLVSVAFTVLLVGLGLDFAIHLLLHVQERRSAGQSMRRSLQGATLDAGGGLALAAPTTAIGFFAFIPTRFDGIAQLGIIAGAGVVIAFLTAVTLLPAALGAMTPPPPRPASGAVRRFFSGLEKISIPVAVIVTGLGVLAATLAPQARFDADPMSLRDPASPSVRGFNALFDDPDAAPYRLTRLVNGREEALATAARAERLAPVRATRTLEDFVPGAQETKLERIDFAAGSLAFTLQARAEGNARSAPAIAAEDGARVLRERLVATYAAGSPGAELARALGEMAENPAALAQYEERIFRYWPLLLDRLFAQLNADYVDIDALPAALAKRYRTGDGRWRVDILPRGDMRAPAALDVFVGAVEAAFPDIGGSAIQARKAGDVISEAMLQATIIAFVLITGFLWLLLRRVDDVILMLFPLALAAVLTAATGVLFDIPFNYANVIVLPLLIGIGVDSGVHLVMRHRHMHAGETVFGTSTPRAVLFAALTTVASFGSLMLSPHRGTASMGQLLSIAIAFTLICTLIVLPAAIRLRHGRGRRRERAKLQTTAG